MRLQIPLTEVQQFISSQYKFDVDLRNIGENKIEAKYIDSVILKINEVKDNTFFFRYEVDGLATVVTKVAHFFLEKKLDNTPVEWDSTNRKLQIDLNKIPELNKFLTFASISELHFINDAIVLDVSVNWQNIKPS